MDFEILTLNDALATKTASFFKKEAVFSHLEVFHSGEIKVSLRQNIKNNMIFLIQSIYEPINEVLLSLFFLINRIKGKDIILIVPYLAYSRQDKLEEALEVVVKFFRLFHIKQFYVVDLHSAVEDIKNLSLANLISSLIKEKIGLKDTCIACPDRGAIMRCEEISKILDLPVIFFKKIRNKKVSIFVDTVPDFYRNAVVLDDIIDTAETAVSTAERLKAGICEKVYGFFSHPVLSNDSVNKIERSSFSKIFVSNSIPLKIVSKKIDVFDISSVLIDIVKLESNGKNRY